VACARDRPGSGSGSPASGGGLAPQFSPSQLNPLYYTVTNDSTDDGSGRVLNIASRQNPLHVWTQSTPTDRPILNTSLIPGRKVWQFDASTTARRWLLLASAALAGQLNGPVPFTMACYVRVATMPTSGTPDFIGHTLSTTSYGNPSIRFRLSPAANGTSNALNGATRQVIYTQALTFGANARLLCITYNGTTTLKTFLDGVQQGSDSVMLATGNIAGMTNIVLGDATTSAGPNRLYYVLGHFACLGQLAAAQQLNLSAWYAARFV
jgi:hypothetical protein